MYWDAHVARDGAQEPADVSCPCQDTGEGIFLVLGTELKMAKQKTVLSAADCFDLHLGAGAASADAQSETDETR